MTNISSNEEMGTLLNTNQEQFCQNFVVHLEFRNNATLSYADAYEHDLETLKNMPNSEYQRVYDNCSASASRLLKNDKIQSRITALLNNTLSNDVVDAELAKMILQNTDLPVKMAGIREYNKLRGRLVEKQELKTDFGGSVIVLPVLRDENEVPRIDFSKQ
jgi:hypothetical protein